jgi:hypothetical protein
MNQGLISQVKVKRETGHFEWLKMESLSAWPGQLFIMHIGAKRS